MKRYNLFYLIHKGLRAMLYDAALTLQQTDFINDAEALPALEKINDVLFTFDNHAHHEDSFVLPAVETYEPELAASFEQQHAEDHRIANELKNLIAIYESTFFAEEKIICASAITKSFTEFIVFNLQHMAKEEMLLNQALWQHYTDEQIIEIEQELLAYIPPTEMQKTSRWMMRAINTTDALNWLKRVKATASPGIFNILLGIAEEELSEKKFGVILEALQAQTIAA